MAHRRLSAAFAISFAAAAIVGGSALFHAAADPGPTNTRGFDDVSDAALLAQARQVAQADSDGSLLDETDEGSDNGGDGLLSGESDEGGDNGGDLLSEESDGSGEAESDADDGDLLGEGKSEDDGSDSAGGGLLGSEEPPADEAEKDKTAEKDKEAETEKTTASAVMEDTTAFEMHLKAVQQAEGRYPQAETCAKCHPRQYKQWSVSSHAYGQLSPVYMAMQMTLNRKSSGTVGDFCMRCHTPVGGELGESPYLSNLKRKPVSREGVTCIACHRVKKAYSEHSGRLPIAEGKITEPVFGPSGNEGVKKVIEDSDYQVVTDGEKPGRAIHKEARQLFQIRESGFCGGCHDVTSPAGFRLEEAFAEYHQSPASAEGVSCQDCHMGKEQGVASGYDTGPVAVVGGKPTTVGKITNHYFAGPDYPIIHEGLFPHSREADSFKSMAEWLQFETDKGWGTEEFEQSVSLDREFPDPWLAPADRYEGRDIIREQEELLEWARQERLEAMRNGYGLSDIRITEADSDRLAFELDVHNKTDGHGLPTGFDAERVLFLQVKVRNADGDVVFVSGDRDPNGDLRDSHSLYVHRGEVPLDKQLYTLQTRFVVRMESGGEREEILANNRSFSPQPLMRPETRASTIYGGTRGARKHGRNLPPNGSDTARYVVDGDRLDGNGPYSVSARFVVQMVPVNLIAAIQDAGFDYGLSPREVADRVVDGAMTVHERETTVQIDQAD